MDCPDEEREIRAALSRLPGVEDLSFDLLARRVEVRHRGGPEPILAALRRIGMEGRLLDDSLRGAGLPASRRAPLALFAACTVLVAAAGLARLAAPGAGWDRWILGAAVAAGGLPVAVRGAGELRGRSLGMNALMTVSIAGAAALGETAEAAVVVTLFALANYLEARALDRAREAAAALFAEAPTTAVVRVGGVEGTEQTVPAERVRPGEVIIVRPGERVPVDAVVRKGTSEVNEAILTGESVPVEKSEGDQLFAGTVNGRGLLIAEAVRPLDASTFARIVRRVEQARQDKAPIQTFMERFARVYTPAVLAGAAAVAAVPPLTLGAPVAPWAYRALVLLVIACPCALVLAAPVATASALARAARTGILAKSARHLEVLGRIQAVAFDKTGTLTRGRLRVVRVAALGGATEEEILRLAGAVEAASAHPAAEAIRHEARRRGMARPARGTLARTLTLFEGRGVAAEVEGRRIYVGSRRLFEERGALPPTLARSLPADGEEDGRIVSLVGTEEGPAGFIEMEDELRPEAPAAVAALRALGIGHIVMLTGDRTRAASAAAAAAGIEEVLPEMSPEDKMEAIRHLVARYGAVAMVGDGVNDAPALALASVGVAMGTAGSPAALEAADVALMADSLLRIPEAIRAGRAMVRAIRQNVAAALLVKAGFVGLAVAGHATLWMAVAADMGTSLLVILNGLRLLGLRREGR